MLFCILIFSFFQGSLDGKEWTIIREHINDTSLDKKSQPHTWKLETSNYYSKFRVVQCGENSNRHLYLCLSGMELYGNLLKKRNSKPLSKNQTKTPSLILTNLIPQERCYLEIIIQILPFHILQTLASFIKLFGDNFFH